MLRHRVFPAASVIFTAFLVNPLELANAQTVSQATAQQRTGLEEVVVTVRRRQEDIQRVPTAVVALGAAQLAEQNIVTQTDLQSAVPGLTLRETQGSIEAP
jgi:iron complex outermembrane receptor protein